MPEKIRMKFKVVESGCRDGNPPVGSVKLYPVGPKEVDKDGKASFDPDNAAFWSGSPNAALELNYISADAVKKFEFGQEFYLDFTPVE